VPRIRALAQAAGLPPRTDTAIPMSAVRMTRCLLRHVARMLIGVLLFAQLAISAHACPAQFDGAAASGASMPGASADALLGAADAAAPNVCGEHCKPAKQSDQTPTLAVPALLRGVAYRLDAPRELVTSPARESAALTSRLAAAAPPHSILHCVLRT
jgi:hypothetical protein